MRGIESGLTSGWGKQRGGMQGWMVWGVVLREDVG